MLRKTRPAADNCATLSPEPDALNPKTSLKPAEAVLAFGTCAAMPKSQSLIVSRFEDEANLVVGALALGLRRSEDLGSAFVVLGPFRGSAVRVQGLGVYTSRQ